MIDKSKLTPRELKNQIRLEAALRRWERKQAQTPPDADLDAIQAFYDNTPEGYTVDHIIPLARGGLHSVENFQYLTHEENTHKGCLLPCEWTKYRIYKERQRHEQPTNTR